MGSGDTFVEREVDKEGGEQAGDRTAQDDVVIFFLKI